MRSICRRASRRRLRRPGGRSPTGPIEFEICLARFAASDLADALGLVAIDWDLKSSNPAPAAELAPATERTAGSETHPGAGSRAESRSTASASQGVGIRLPRTRPPEFRGKPDRALP